MLLLLKNSPRLRRLTDSGLEVLVYGANALRFHHEIRHPDNGTLHDNYRALRERQAHLRADLDALLSANILLEDLSVQTVIEELDQVAHALGMLREDVLHARPGRILREIVQSAAA